MANLYIFNLFMESLDSILDILNAETSSEERVEKTKSFIAGLLISQKHLEVGK
jgi:hypothetical protein